MYPPGVAGAAPASSNRMVLFAGIAVVVIAIGLAVAYFAGAFSRATPVANVPPVTKPTTPATPTEPPPGMVYVVGGTFTMGKEGGDEYEGPPHSVEVKPFFIDTTEVTNKQYAQCVEAGACNSPIKTNSDKRESYYGNPEFDDHPVIEMRWEDANAYCTWAGRNLPTEAQWEKAARGTDGRIFPWGNENPNETLLNYNQNVGDTTEGGSYEGDKSPYGAYDMAGNVMEWTNDRYSQVYYSKSPAENPTGPEAGETFVMRGGTLYTGRYVFVRATDRSQGIAPLWYYAYIGFRCATANP